ncbi:MAG: hypothetical protein H6667_12350 [Ardenticatenaceae bacterium]|nr:hypothetical protein [Ardenticatenaceae bacterium]MCB9443576.1 hypothetical protein [Ardenticatenaceae bacterium]
MDNPKALTVSDRLYRWLLFVYPTAFRREYGPHMAQLFRDQCRAAYEQGRLTKLIRLWIGVFPDLAKSALAEHIWEVLQMFKRITVRETIYVGSPVLFFAILFMLNPFFMKELFVLRTPFLIAPIIPWGWVVVLAAIGLTLMARFLLGAAHGTTLPIRNSFARIVSLLLIILAHFLIFLGPAVLSVVRVLEQT